MGTNSGSAWIKPALVVLVRFQAQEGLMYDSGSGCKGYSSLPDGAWLGHHTGCTANEPACTTLCRDRPTPT
ncbi:MAG: hypothetical protein ABFC89_10805 [Methanospirillum sp.]